MSWEDELQPASFRGVPFEVEADTFAAGRRNQLHEYVQRDVPYVEDLGRATRGISITGFLNGEDCFDQARALVDAFEEAGPGELVHPWYGRMMVSTDGLPTLRRERREGRTIRFEATFFEAGELAFPTTSTDTSSGLLGAGSLLAGASSDSFGNWLSGINLTNVSSASWLTTGARFMDVFGNLSIASYTSPFSGFLSQFTGVQGFAASFLSSPLAFAATLLGLPALTTYRYTGTPNALVAAGSTASAIASVADVPAPTGADAAQFQRASIELAQDALLEHATRELATVGINTSGREGGSAAGSTGGSTGGGTAGSAGAGPSDPPSVASIDRQVSTPHADVDEAGEPIVPMQPPVVDDVLEVRDALEDAIWSMAQAAGYDRFQALMDTRAALLRHLTALARSGVRLVAITPTGTLPSLVLAYRRYGDATRAAEIVTRNRIVHPGFVPPRRLLVAER